MKVPGSRIYQRIEGLILKNRRAIITAFYFLQAACANYLAFFIRFDASVPDSYKKEALFYLPYLLILRIVFFIIGGLHKDLWRYSSVDDLLKIVYTSTAGSLLFFMWVRYFYGDTSYPRSIYVLDWMLIIMISGGTRLFIRVFRDYLAAEPSGKKILLIGAGDAGEMIVRDMKNNPSYAYEPIGFIDDDRYKKGMSIHGIPIFGPRSMIREVIDKHKPEEIIIAMPSKGHRVITDIYELCKPFNVPIKTLPGLNDILDGRISVSQIKPLSLEDLLQRERIRTDIESVKLYIEGKTVMVTGAGGSIGSELCRQIVEYRPSCLIMLDRYENGLFYVDMELKSKIAGQRAKDGEQPAKGPAKLVAVIGDVCDRTRMEEVFGKYQPRIVFHAAAHKHVPLMEQNPLEAVKNNILGTKNLLDAAAGYGAESFVMISTDKAVNPSNVMGATKRMAEYLTMSMNHTSSCRFTTVRFGNVLGSSGSVVRIFKEQLKKGGPLTVTHPEIKRYFMLIPEAVQLVLIAASSGVGGDIFILDMGEQIKIVDLAENIIRLSGFIPYEEIGIEFTGLRPGEKMFEELFDASEKIVPSSHERLKVAFLDTVPSGADLSEAVSRLERIVKENSVEEAVSELQKIVSNFRK
jgi:FlaA1/EpsC-like NDP-sugar epimerase